eukprot:TRINITY_DN38208_c0_g1_i1.p1 TRINITY_DN38208_c0_g1~~TRINITY_DN38208_c0_g1_i1.p1  ORF type:complete len:432 (+),score=68.26 TRINITY_DN38208_c0_g1_i1:95-1390(+)
MSATGSDFGGSMPHSYPTSPSRKKPEGDFYVTITRMNGDQLAKMRVNAKQTVKDLIDAIKEAAKAPDLSLCLAFESEVLDEHLRLGVSGLYDGAVVTAIRWPELFLAACYADGITKIFSAEAGATERVFDNGHGIGDVTDAAFALSGLSLLLGCMDGMCHLYSVAGGEKIREYKGHGGPISCLVSSPDGKYMATGCFDRSAMVLDYATSELKAACDGHRGTIMCLSFDNHSKLLITGSEDCTAKMWDIHDANKKEITFEGHRAPVTAARFSPHGKVVATGSMDGDVRVWNVFTHKQEKCLQGGVPVVSMTFNPAGMILAVGCSDSAIRLWSLGTAAMTMTLQVESYVPTKVRCVAFSHSGHQIAAASDNGSIDVWSMKKGVITNHKSFQGHIGMDGHTHVPAVSVAFTPGPLPSDHRPMPRQTSSHVSNHG